MKKKNQKKLMVDVLQQMHLQPDPNKRFELRNVGLQLITERKKTKRKDAQRTIQLNSFS